VKAWRLEEFQAAEIIVREICICRHAVKAHDRRLDRGRVLPA
jgi:hypothetical protein